MKKGFKLVFWMLTLCSDVVGYQCFRGPGCLHLQGEVNGAGKRGIDRGREYKRGYSLADSRKQERIVIVGIRGEQCGVLD
jgi:hypothetical protein